MKKSVLLLKNYSYQKINSMNLIGKIKEIEVGMMISVVYYESNQYIYKEGIVTEIDLTYKKMLKIVDKLIDIGNILVINKL